VALSFAAPAGTIPAAGAAPRNSIATVAWLIIIALVALAITVGLLRRRPTT
jgi:hypothetical protein